MNLLLFTFLTLLAAHQAYGQIPANYTTKYFSQRLDHFSYARTETFQQRYLISTDHWCPAGCPVFFYAGNEGDIEMFAANTGFMWEQAPAFQAAVVFAEHRYYGTTMPYGNASLDDLPRAGYLTAEQALADFAALLIHLHQTDLKTSADSPKAPVIVFGGSYGGMLAAWFRMKYPALVVGAHAASAPILQFPGIYDCSKFNQRVTDDFTGYSPNCSDNIRKSWAAIRRIAAEGAAGLSWLQDQFVVCSPPGLKTSDQLEELMGWLANLWTNLAMTDYPNPASFLAPLPAYPIKVTCSHLQEAPPPASGGPAADRELVSRVARAAQVFTNYTGATDCNDINLDDDPTQGLSNHGWDFQACTEMVMPVCGDGQRDMFEPVAWNLTEYAESCREKWRDIKLDPGKVELLFGGKNINASSNIIFTNGERDPWAPGGVLETYSESMPAIIIPGACHHEDLRATGPNDPQVLRDVRERIVGIFRSWLADYYGKIYY